MKRYEVRVDCFVTLFPGKRYLVAVREYRWRWTAQLACLLYNRTPGILSFYVATMRPILRAVK